MFLENHPSVLYPNKLLIKYNKLNNDFDMRKQKFINNFIETVSYFNYYY